MAQTYSIETAGIDSVPVVKPSAITGYGARTKRFRASITLASQASGDTIVLADLPAGVLFDFAMVTTSVTLGTATLSLGTAASATAFSPAATYTTANVPALACSAAAAAAAPLSATTRVIATIGTAALPASGTLVIDLYVNLPN